MPVRLKQLDVAVVSAGSVVADHALVRGDGGARAVQGAAVTVNDTAQMDELKTATFDAEYNNGNLGATPTINWNNGQKQRGTISASITSITFTAPPGPGNFLLKLTQNGTGGYTVPGSAWPSTVRTGQGKVPVVTTVANAVSIFSIYYDGTNYWVQWGMQDWKAIP
jgi:hypothetical protein